MAFWDNVKWILFFVAPIILVFFATDTIGHVIRMIRSAITDEANKDKDDDDDDYDVYRY